VSTDRSGRPVWRGTRAASLSRLRDRLLDADPPSLGLTRRTLDDPTVALLDAWATVTDVLSFYDDRIWDEGFLGSAVEDGSVLGLLELTGVTARPGVGAGVALAYLLHDDPTDAVVELPAGLLSQTVPGPGEEVQTFETVAPLRARPSWSRLGLRTHRPLEGLPPGTAGVRLMVQGVTSRVAVGDHLLWRQGDEATALRVAEVSTDLRAGTTTLDVLPLRPRRTVPVSGEPRVRPPSSLQAPAVGPVDAAGWSPVPLLARLRQDLDTGLPGVATTGAADDGAAWSGGFDVNSDMLPRLVEALHPELAGDLYVALATSRRPLPSGPPTLAAMQVTAAPFGAAAATPPALDPMNRSDRPGDWPLDDTVELRIRLTGPRDELTALRAGDLTPGSGSGSWLSDDIITFLRNGIHQHRGLLSIFGIGAALDQELADAGERLQRQDLERLIREQNQQAQQGQQGEQGEQGEQGRQGQQGQAGHPAGPVVIPSRLLASVTATAPGRPVQHEVVELDQAPSVSLGPLGRLDVRTDEADLVMTYDPGEARGAGFEARVSFEQSDESVTFTIGTESCVWYPAARAQRFTATLGARRLDIELGDAADDLVVTLRLPRASTKPGVLHLDRVYPQIVPGSTVVLTCPDDARPPGTVDYPAVRTVLAADTVTCARYGLSAEVTRLELCERWVDEATSLAQVRGVRVHAAPAALDLLPSPVLDDLSGDRLELAALHQGIEPGRQLVVTGDRTDLPGQATTTAGELVEVRSVALDADPGGRPFTTVTLRRPLQHSYRRSSVTLHGNVVTAHQSATTTEVLGPGDPTLPHQQLTLSDAPLLAEPSGHGVVSSLVVHVDGRRYDEVSRLDEGTPATSYVCALDGRGHTALTFASPLPAGSGNVVATYRAGWGSRGNARAGQVSQLLSRPLAVEGVTNPLPASGGADPETAATLRQRAGTGLRALGRAVSLEDYRDLALGWAGVGKATATSSPDARGRSAVVVDVAGTSPAPLEPGSPLVAGLQDTLTGPEPTVQVTVRAVEPLIVFVRLRVARDPAWTWESVSTAVRAALVDDLGYPARDIGQPLLVADVLLSAQSPRGVVAASVAGVALVPPSATPAELVELAQALRLPVPLRTEVGASQLAFVDPSVPGSLLLEEESW
jgi:predicted phage baseplate assembly protein